MAKLDSSRSGLDMAALIAAVDQELTSTLLRYSSSLPMSLITAGKFALAAPGKVMAVRQTAAQDLDSLPRWPLIVLLSCQAASPPGSLDAWNRRNATLRFAIETDNQRIIRILHFRQ